MSEPDGVVIPQRRTLLGRHDLVHGLVHIATPYRTEWRSLCGFDFLSYQTTLEDRVVTCVWCVIGATRRVRFGFADTGLRNPCAEIPLDHGYKAT